MIAAIALLLAPPSAPSVVDRELAAAHATARAQLLDKFAPSLVRSGKWQASKTLMTEALKDGTTLDGIGSPVVGLGGTAASAAGGPAGNAFHALWNRGNDDPSRRFLIADRPEITRARLALADAIGQIIRNGLRVMGVTAAEEMH